MFQCVKILAKFLSAVNEILSTNSRNLPVYSELISLAEKALYDGELAPEILNTKDHAITFPSTSRTPSQRSDTSNVSSQGIPTTGTTRERHSQRNSGVLDAHDLSSHETPSTSFMNITPAGRRSQSTINGFQRSVLAKLELLIDKQEEALSVLRALLSNKKGVDEHEILEDVVRTPFDWVEEL
ncbi:uncharacterized protein LOC124456465 isoform X2 [Xenia sp. Carnegie-2017]|uniref:uncharacterized protein LOC124456465 isoform X2 n=1 Tax=Xenia sp. Carnegie-2017 TaxID=2897299 RepID=UPI001F04C911|nr:uncharacterized protein LOC124456465 isoform X2 [Xenia sp. Carnegie-2017]